MILTSSLSFRTSSSSALIRSCSMDLSDAEPSEKDSSRETGVGRTKSLSGNDCETKLDVLECVGRVLENEELAYRTVGSRRECMSSESVVEGGGVA